MDSTERVQHAANAVNLTICATWSNCLPSPKVLRSYDGKGYRCWKTRPGEACEPRFWALAKECKVRTIPIFRYSCSYMVVPGDGLFTLACSALRGEGLAVSRLPSCLHPPDRGAGLRFFRCVGVVLSLGPERVSVAPAA